MTRVRRALGPIAVVWLACQAATLMIVPARLGASLAECACSHGADATCPMHHGAATSRVCVVQSMTASGAATVNALFGVVGLVSVRSLAVAPVPATSALPVERPMAIGRPSPPDPPPPRA
jgi:hypothetical protein